MPPRITFCLTTSGTLEMFFNAEGRAAFLSELSQLDGKNDHFHFAPLEIASELPVSTVAYRVDDKVLAYGKVFLRSDDDDAKYFPHVLTSAL